MHALLVYLAVSDSLLPSQHITNISMTTIQHYHEKKLEHANTEVFARSSCFCLQLHPQHKIMTFQTSLQCHCTRIFTAFKEGMQALSVY